MAEASVDWAATESQPLRYISQSNKYIIHNMHNIIQSNKSPHAVYTLFYKFYPSREPWLIKYPNMFSVNWTETYKILTKWFECKWNHFFLTQLCDLYNIYLTPMCLSGSFDSICWAAKSIEERQAHFWDYIVETFSFFNLVQNLYFSDEKLASTI